MSSTTEAPTAVGATVTIPYFVRKQPRNDDLQTKLHFLSLIIFMEKGGCVYITTNEHHTTLYTGVTVDLPGRIVEHREKVYPGSFTARYNLTKLVYYESFHSIEEAIEREKQLKSGQERKRKN